MRVGVHSKQGQSSSVSLGACASTTIFESINTARLHILPAYQRLCNMTHRCGTSIKFGTFVVQDVSQQGQGLKINKIQW